jgi:branched-chain amino acid transport system substrate-binding protein
MRRNGRSGARPWAVKRANSLDPERIAEALRRTRGFPGATGAITFDQDRNPVGKEVSMLKFRNGAWRYFKSISPGR